MLKNMIMQIAANDPQLVRAVDVMEAQLARNPIVPEDLDEAIQLLEFVILNSDKYKEVRQAAINDNLIREDLIPAEFDIVFVVSLLIALYGLQDRLSERGYARGGLTVAARRLQSAGRGGDTELVHVNRREKEMLRRMGGAGTINPNTGLREYKGKSSNIVGALLPVALDFIAPSLGSTVGGMINSTLGLGLGQTATNIIGSGLVGAGAGAILGQNPIQGAVRGALSGGLGGALGSGIAGVTGMDPRLANLLSGSLIGAGTAAATGRNPLSGALRGAVGSGAEMLGAAAGPAFGATDAIGRSLTAAGQGFGRALTSGYDPMSAGMAGGAAALAAGLSRPSENTVQNMRGGQTGSITSQNLPNIPGTNVVTNLQTPNLVPSTPSVAAPTAGGGLTSSNALPLLLGGATLMSALSGPQQPQVQQAVRSLSPAQQEFMNRPSVSWDWNKMQRDAAASNLTLDQYMARNWNRITSGEYNVQQRAQGGLSALSRFVRGGGTGRSDEISAKLSDGEYVIDAETVAMLGDGSSSAGAKRLDEMRESIRRHKGKKLAKGKFSPDAKSPLTYIKGAA